MARGRRARMVAVGILCGACSPGGAQLLGQAPVLEGGGGEFLPVEDGRARPEPRPTPRSGPSAATERSPADDFTAIAEGPEVPLSTEGEIFADSLWQRFSWTREEPEHWWQSGRPVRRDLQDPEGVRNLFREYARLRGEEDQGFRSSMLAAGFLNGLRKPRGSGTEANAGYDRFTEMRPRQRWHFGQTFLANNPAPLGRLVHAMDHRNPTFYARRLRWTLEDWQEQGSLSRSDELAIHLLRTYPEDFHVPFARGRGAFDGVDVPNLP